MSLVGEGMGIKLADLEKITDYFSPAQIVGAGGYGIVYRGMYNGQEIAVKKLHPLQGLDDTEFENEFLNLTMVHHQNVVRFIGYCHELKSKYSMHNRDLAFAKKKVRVLCFEYVQGGSLDKHINDESCYLDWPTCYKIIRGTCEGLNHLHNAYGRPIYHGDLKPSNILLDKNLTAKIGDIGLSRIVSSSSKTHKAEILKGTHGGYMPPEYIKSGHISPKFDVFSLGVIILKIMAGNKGHSRCFELPPKQFVELVIDNWKKRLPGNKIDILVEACVSIALRCVDDYRPRRPTIRDIVDELERLEWSKKQLPLQSYQAFFGENYRYANARFDDVLVE